MTRKPQEADLDEWRRYLEGAPPVLDLPSDRPRPAAPRRHRHVVRRTVDEALETRLRALAHRAGVPLRAVLLGAFVTLLHRWTGESDVVVGISNLDARSSSDVALLPLRVDSANGPTFLNLVLRIHDEIARARSLRPVPLARLAEGLAADGPTSHPPFFQVVFTVTDDDKTPLETLDKTRSDATATMPPPFDLTLAMTDGPVGLTATMHARADLFDDETITRLWGRFAVVLEHATRDASVSIDALDCLSADEQRRVLVAFNPPGDPPPSADCLHQMVERQARRTPHVVAVSCGGERLTYQALDARAERIAAQLRRLGVRAGTCVSFSLQRSVDQVAVMLGILKAGGAYVFLDPAWPAERLTHMQEDCAAPLTITETAVLEHLPWTRAVLLDEDGHLSPPIVTDSRSLAPLHHRGMRLAACPVWEAPSGDNLAYVCFTSGSTGRPKGAALTHRNVVGLLDALVDAGFLEPHDVVAAVSSLSFDFHVIETWLPLITGAEVVLVPREMAADGRGLSATLEERGVTAMFGTPVTYRILLQAGWSGGPSFKIHSGGELLPPEIIEPLLDRCALWNVYGPTETTVYATTHRVRRGETPAPIGRPLPNARLYVVDTNGRLLPPGAWGELLIGGACVGRGYMNRPELTAERFIDNPFAQTECALGLAPSPRLYRSGDVARWRADGAVEIRGRVDTQVKVRGFRIELGEIEAVLCGHPSVQHAAVTVTRAADGDARLVGYLVSSSGELALDEVRNHLARHLPSYMRPSLLVPLDAIPLTATGKIDRRALPPPDTRPAPRSGPVVAPRTPLELQVVQAWEEVLSTGPVGVTDRYSEMGGTSLLFLRILARLEVTLGRTIAVGEAFRHDTPEALATHLSQDPSLDGADAPDVDGRLASAMRRGGQQRQRFDGKTAEL